MVIDAMQPALQDSPHAFDAVGGRAALAAFSFCAYSPGPKATSPATREAKSWSFIYATSAFWSAVTVAVMSTTPLALSIVFSTYSSHNSFAIAVSVRRGEPSWVLLLRAQAL